MEGNRVTVSVRLGLDQLQRDAAEAAQRIRSTMQSAEAPVAIKFDKSGIASLAQDVLKAKAGLSDGNQSVMLQREAALLQEAVRFKQQLADIENAYVDPEDLENAKRLAAELNDLNKQKIDRDFLEIPPPKGLAGHAQAFQDAVNGASLYTQALTQVGQQLSQAGAQVNDFTKQAAAAAIAFDDARAKVSTLSDDADGMAEAMRGLSEDLNYQANSTDLLNASYDVLSSGFEKTADVSEILKASTLGAQGGFSDVGTVADATTTILNAYKMSASDASRVVDILAQTQDAGKITIDQYAGTIGRVASIAAMAGVSLEEMSAAVATATAKGVPAESSISGTRQAIVNLLKPTADAQAMLEKFGISNSSAALKSDGLIGILQKLKDQGATSDQLAKIFSDVDALATVTTLAGENLGDFKNNLEGMNNSAGKAAASADKVANSFSGQMTAATNQANEALVSLGNGVTKAINPLIGALVFLMQNFNELPEPVKEAVGIAIALTGGLLTLAGAIAAVAAVIPVITAGFTAMAGMATAAAGALTGAGAGAAAAGTGATAAAGGVAVLQASMVALLPVVLAVAGAIAAVKFLEMVNSTEEIDAAMQSLGANADNALGAAQRTKNTIESLNAARASGRSLTAQEVSDGQKLVTANEARLKQLQQDLQLAQQLPATTEAQRNAKAALVAQTEKMIEVLGRQNTGLKELVGQSGAAAGATGETAAATEAAGSAYEQLGAKYEQSLSQLESANKLRQTETAESVAQGLITEEQGRQQNLEGEQRYLSDRLALNQQKLAELRSLTASDPEEQKKIQADIAAVESAVADDRLAIAQNLSSQRVEAEKRAADQIKKQIEDVNLSAQRESTGVRQRQAGGEISESDANAEIAGIEANATARSIELIQQRLAAVRAGSDEERDLQGQLADLQEKAANQEIARQEAVAKARLDAIERANKQAEAAIDQAQTAEETAVLQLQRDRVISAEEAEARIAAIKQRGLNAEVEQTQQQIASVQQLRAEGVLSEEEASDRLMQLNGRLGTLNQQRVEAEIAAQERLKQIKIDALNKELEAKRRAATVEQGMNSLKIGAIAQQNNLLSAQSNLLSAQSDLEQQRYQYAIEDAEAAGNSARAEQLRREAINAQIASQEEQFAIEQEQLTLQQQQNALELENQKIQADVAIAEAEVALAQARINGASAEEIAGLERILGLRQQQRAAIDDQAASQERLNAAERQSLNTNQQRQREESARARQQQSQSSSSSGSTGSGSSGSSSGGSSSGSTGSSSGGGSRSSGGGGGGRSGGGAALTAVGSNEVGMLDRAMQLRSGSTGDAFGRAMNSMNNPYTQAALAASGREDVLKLQQLAKSSFQGNMQAGRISAAVERGDISKDQVGPLVDKLMQGINRLANSPRNVTLNTPDPIRDYQQISSDLMQGRMNSAGL